VGHYDLRGRIHEKLDHTTHSPTGAPVTVDAEPGIDVPYLPAPEIETMRGTMASLVASQLFVMRLLALFAGIAITLAAMGIYSVLVYSVEQRAHEMGIRLALNAKQGRIMGLIIGRGLRLSITGAIIGAAGGLALTRYLKSLLYGVTPHDPITLAVGLALVIVVALCAAYFPARRAVNQDPIATLRIE
jgi:ABC-type antimicrobial peptide transport system permease subunit